jgi:biotin-[acetyl-CoA-carboxylase] ligase BirA-like protein
VDGKLYWADRETAGQIACPTAAGYASVGVDQLNHADQTLWQLFSPEPILAQAHGTANSTFPERRLIIIDHAPTSQFEQARKALAQGQHLPDGLICMALAGDRHRGQRQRSWTALRGNLHLTAHYRFDTATADIETGLTMLPAVACASAIAIASADRARPTIKWVNDVLLADRKVSGVLTSVHRRHHQVESALFGIGINVAHAPEIPVAPHTIAAGSLAAYRIDLATMLHTLIAEMDTLVSQLHQGGSAALYPLYRARCDLIGRHVTLWPEEDDNRPAPLCTGVVEDLLPDLSLVLTGQSSPIRTGRLTYT